MSRHSYRPEIDGLRAIAVTAVILSHMGDPFSYYLGGGFIGVDVFFVISGFLITSIIFREMHAGTFTFHNFYERRAWRILPALILVTLVSALFAWELMSPEQLTRYSQSLVGIGLFASNIYFWLTSGYFATSSEELPMIHTWSLAVEEQFYVFFPLLLCFLWRRARVMTGLTVALIIGLVLAEVMGRFAPSAAFYLVVSRAWELLAGSLAGYFVARYGLPDGTSGPPVWQILGTYRTVLGWVGALGLAVSLAFYTGDFVTPGLLFIVPVGSAVLLLVCVHKDGLLCRVLAVKPMVAIGLISYSMYLWHQPVFAFLRIAYLDYPSPWIMTCAGFGVVLLAWLSWALVEQPFRKKKLHLLHAVIVLGGLMITITGIGLAGHIQNGFGPQRFDPVILAAFDAAAHSPDRDKCHNLPPYAACQYNIHALPMVTVLGDSHAVELTYSLAKTLKDYGYGVTHLSRSGCPPALTFETNVNGCANWITSAIDALENSPPATIILIYRHAFYLSGSNYRADITYPALPDTPHHIQSSNTADANRSTYWSSFQTMVMRLLSARHNVIVVQPFPEISRPITSYLLRSEYDVETSSIISTSRAYYEARTADIREKLITLAENRNSIELFDPVPVFCDAQYCYAMRDGIPLYFDDNHPSVMGTDIITENLISIILNFYKD